MAELGVIKLEAKRSVHLVDLENLLGGADFSEADVVALMGSYRTVAECLDDDHLIVATCYRAALSAWFGCPDARRLVRSGADGADLALLEVIQNEGLARRFDRVVIASGDAIFAPATALLQLQGAEVVVVSRPDALSTALRIAVRDIRVLGAKPGPVVPLRLRVAA